MAERDNRGRETSSEFIERVVHIARVAKVVKGGRRFSFSCIAVVGDGKGRVGYGLGKANEVPDAVRKAIDKGKRAMTRFAMKGTSIPHDVEGNYGAAKVMLKPAAKGTGVIAGGAVRAVVEAAGIHDILTKCIGTNNPHNVIKATLNGLRALQSAEANAAMRSNEKVAQQAA